MKNSPAILRTIGVLALCGMALAPGKLGAQTPTYQLDNGSVKYPLDASDATEPRDNWFGNVFMALAGANVITRVDYGLYTTTSNSTASVVLYRVTDPGGNPALGTTRVYTQSFTPFTGDGTNAFLQPINLTSPVTFNVGDRFLVAVFIPNVIAAPPNDVYPYLLDTSGVATGTYWDRSDPNAFNLDDLSQARLIDQTFVSGGFTPGAGHIIIRAWGGAPIADLYDTGINPAGTGLQPLGSADAHWTLATPYPTSASGQPVPLPSTLTFGPAFVNSPDSAWLADGPNSQWITPTNLSNPGGNYIYQTTFHIPSGYDPTTASITGRWSSDNEGIAVWLNDSPLAGFPLPGPASFNGMINFTITNGVAGATFQPGLNKLSFQVRNRGIGGIDTNSSDTGIRVEFASSVVQLTNGVLAPVITQQPQSLTVTQGQTAAFFVQATGTPPLSYQWLLNGSLIPGATNNSYSLTNAQLPDAGLYSVVVSNAFGTATSFAMPLAVWVNFHAWVTNGANFTNAQAQLEQQGVIISEASAYFRRFTCLINSTQLNTISSLPFVRAIEPVFQAKTYNLWSRNVDNAINVQDAPWGNVPNAFHLTGGSVTLGSGRVLPPVNIGVWDGGMPLWQTVTPSLHPDYASRLTLMEPNCVSDPRHPTHVIGTLAGDGSALASLSYAGMAPKATVEAWDFSTPDPSAPPTICGTGNDPSTEMLAARTLTLPPPIAGYSFPQLGTLSGGPPPIDISQNSWGYPPVDATTCDSFGNYYVHLFGKYLNLCSDYDQMVCDTELPIIFAAGNSQDGCTYGGCEAAGAVHCVPGPWGTVTPIATAKNVISVGAIEQSDQLTIFSSCGPTTDGRLKPDVVALGNSVISTWNPDTTPHPPTSYFPYNDISGTSMAAPAVSGVAALLVEEYRTTLDTANRPMAALLKAVLCNTATDLGNPGPDFKYGYGVVNAVAAATVIQSQQYVEVTPGLSSGDPPWTKTITIPPGGCSTELKVMVAWSDPECLTGCDSKALVNDLDLVVNGPGGPYFPFVLDPSNPSHAAKTPSTGDHTNNVEQVVIANPVAGGTYTIQINGYKVPSGPQPFAVTWWWDNCPPPPLSCAPQTTRQPIKGLFNTGVDDHGNLLVESTWSSSLCHIMPFPDPHYKLTLSSAILAPPPVAEVEDFFGGTVSQPIAVIDPQSGCLNVNGNPGLDVPWGPYTFSTTFDLTCADPTTAIITGKWWADDRGEIKLNGQVVYNAAAYRSGVWSPLFTISSGFLPGLNLLEFDTENVGDNTPADMQVEMTGTACYYTPTTATPLGSYPACPGDSVTFSTTAGGPGPFSYVWTHNGSTIPGATGSSYMIPAVLNADAGYYCVTVTGPYPGNVVPACGTATQCGVLCVSTPPTATPLTSLSVCAGQSATFTTTTAGGGSSCNIVQPLYAWTHNGAPIPGSFGRTTYTIASVQLADAGTYCFTASGAGSSPCGSVSQCATLQVNAPLINCPSDITVDCGSDNGAVVLYGPVTTTSPCCSAAALTATCTPASGSLFPIGVTPVTCSVVDACGQANTCTFTVTVQGQGGLNWMCADLEGGAGGESGNALAIDRLGNMYVTGIYASTSHFGPIYGGGKNIFVAKYDEQCNVLWVTSAGALVDVDSIAQGIAVDAVGNIYVTGKFQSSGVGTGPYGLTSKGQEDVFVAKYDPQGNVLWARSFGGAGIDTGTGIAVDNAGNCYVTGEFQGSLVAGTTLLTSGSEDCFVVKYDSSGTVLWAAQSASTTSSDFAAARAIAVDASGDAYVTGELFGTASFGAHSVGQSGTYAVFVAKCTTSLGTWAWAAHSRNSTASGDHDGRGIGVDANGYCYVTAYFNGTADFGLNPMSRTRVSATNNKGNDTSGGQLYDYLIAQFVAGGASGGSPVWVINGGRPDTTSDDETRALAVDAAGNCYVTGFLLYPGATTRFVGAGRDVLVAKYNSGGVLQWSSNPAGAATATDNVGWGIAADGAGCVHVTGAFNESLSFPGLTPLVDSQVPTDVFVATLCPKCSPFAVPSNPTILGLAAHIVGGSLVLSWNGSDYRLQGADSLVNPVWIDVPGSSPFTVQTTTQHKFFRLVSP